VETISRRSRIGDWFLLYQLGKNIDPLIFREFIGDLYKKLESKERDSYS
jgi:innexin